MILANNLIIPLRSLLVKRIKYLVIGREKSLPIAIKGEFLND